MTVGRPVVELETPALVVDLDLLERNLSRAAEYAGAHGLALYPHAKTHKTREIGALQLERGAAGLTTAKSLEAEIFATALGGGLRVAGLSCYPGHLRYDEEQVAAGMREVDRILERARGLFEAAGLDCERISGGSTATLFRSHETPMTEVRPGNYALLDRMEGRGEFALDDCALHVHATVVSTAVPGRFIIDAGSKTLSEAGPPPGATGHAEVVGREDLGIEALSEEHGHGVVAAAAERPAVGDRLRLIPNHACTCVNLHDVLYAARDGVVQAELPVIARGAVR